MYSTYKYNRVFFSSPVLFYRYSHLYILYIDCLPTYKYIISLFIRLCILSPRFYSFVNIKSVIYLNWSVTRVLFLYYVFFFLCFYVLFGGIWIVLFCLLSRQRIGHIFHRQPGTKKQQWCVKTMGNGIYVFIYVLGVRRDKLGMEFFT